MSSKFVDMIFQMRAMMKPCEEKEGQCKGCPFNEKFSQDGDKLMCHSDELSNFVKSLIIEASHDPSVRALVLHDLFYDSEDGFMKQDVEIEMKAKNIDLEKEMVKETFDFLEFKKKMKTADEASEALDGFAEALFSSIIGELFFGKDKDDE